MATSRWGTKAGNPRIQRCDSVATSWGWIVRAVSSRVRCDCAVTSAVREGVLDHRGIPPGLKTQILRPNWTRLNWQPSGSIPVSATIFSYTYKGSNHTLLTPCPYISSVLRHHIRVFSPLSNDLNSGNRRSRGTPLRCDTSGSVTAWARSESPNHWKVREQDSEFQWKCEVLD